MNSHRFLENHRKSHQTTPSGRPDRRTPVQRPSGGSWTLTTPSGPLYRLVQRPERNIPAFDYTFNQPSRTKLPNHSNDSLGYFLYILQSGPRLIFIVNEINLSQQIVLEELTSLKEGIHTVFDSMTRLQGSAVRCHAYSNLP